MGKAVRLSDIRLGIGRTLRITSPERNRAAKGLNINAATSRGAVIYKQMRKSCAKRIPEAIESIYMLYLADTPSALGIVFAPIFQRPEIEILAVDRKLQPLYKSGDPRRTRMSL